MRLTIELEPRSNSLPPEFGERTCPECKRKFIAKAKHQKYDRRTCRDAVFDRERLGASRKRSYERLVQHNGLAAPALKQACEALEAQLTPENRREWPAIIERFGWPRTPGYPDLARLTRACVTAKRFAKGVQ